MYHKKMTRKRGITIPKELAFQTGIDADTPVDLYSENGRIVISKHTPECRFCHDKMNAKPFGGIEVCPSCAEKLRKAVTV